jgi:hypothetical protein
VKLKVVECLPSECEALSSNSSTEKQNQTPQPSFSEHSGVRVKAFGSKLRGGRAPTRVLITAAASHKHVPHAL